MAQTIVTRDATPRTANMLERLVRFIGAIIMGLLLLRFIFTLFGANRGNGIADFVYDASNPLVSPFFGLFNYTPVFGTGRFEYETLIAMLFYAILIGVVARLFAIGQRP